MPLVVRDLAPLDHASDVVNLQHLIRTLDDFTADEKAVALELVDAACAPRPEYDVLVALLDHEVVGYLCYGNTPMTASTFDLYWIAVAARARGCGVARALFAAFEARVRERGGDLVRIETSSQSDYVAARSLYLACGYREAARLEDFYKTGDDLVVYTRKLVTAAQVKHDDRAA